MSSALAFVFSARGAIDAFVVLAAWCGLMPRSATARRTLLAVALAYGLVSSYGVPHLVANAWNAGYHPFQASDAPAGRTAVVLLGASSVYVVGWNGDLTSLSETSAARVLEAYRVYELVSPEWIISSGGHVHPDAEGETSAETMRKALINMGVPADRILLETQSRDTHDEAVIIAPRLRSLHVDHVILVTSDVHMRRSLGTFRAAGIDAVPAMAPDADRLTSSHRWFVPSDEGLRFSNFLAHELLGLPYYWLRGWWRRA